MRKPRQEDEWVSCRSMPEGFPDFESVDFMPKIITLV
jgi:hypothetical protein